MVTRRQFLTQTSQALIAPSLMGLVACNRVLHAGVPQARPGTGGYGELITSSDCPELLIPRGFRCFKLSETLAPSKADPSFIVPQAFDGMAAFALPNGPRNSIVRLIRNHEMRDTVANARPLSAAGPSYDERAGGGTCTLEVRIDPAADDNRVTLLREFVSLSGTHVNCAGGLTPWGSWLSCEETTEGTARGRAQPHGYVFEVSVTAEGPVTPVPLKALGRFVHEAVAVDPETGFLYETEDARYDVASSGLGAGFYRFIPNTRDNLAAGGRLQALAIVGHANYLTVGGQTPGRKLPVRWVDIGDADPASAELDPSAVFRQALAKGAAIFDRLEGCWYGDESIYFNATSGGNARLGQVWRYKPDGDAEDQLEDDVAGHLMLVFESSSRAALSNPDNICTSPRGGVVICEDTGGFQHVRGLTSKGEIFPLVRTAGQSTEFCGACFSPDGSVLFFNVQGSTSRLGTARGGTYALWGPWENGAI